MKKIFIVIIFSVFTLISYSSQNPYYVDEQSYLFEDFIKVKDTLQGKGKYIDGIYINQRNKLFNGKETFRFDTTVTNPETNKENISHVKVECIFKDGKINGLVKIYEKIENLYSSSVLRMVFEMENNIIISDITNYTLEDIQDSKSNICLYGRFSQIDGKIHGMFYRYHLGSGKIAAQIRYEHGVPVGDYNEFFSNGNLQANVKYVNGKKEGVFRRYSPDGKLYMSTIYKNGIKE